MGIFKGFTLRAITGHFFIISYIPPPGKKFPIRPWMNKYCSTNDRSFIKEIIGKIWQFQWESSTFYAIRCTEPYFRGGSWKKLMMTDIRTYKLTDGCKLYKITKKKCESYVLNFLALLINVIKLCKMTNFYLPLIFKKKNLNNKEAIQILVQFSKKKNNLISWIFINLSRKKSM